MNFRRVMTAEQRLVLLLSQPFLSEEQFKKEIDSANLLDDYIDFNKIYNMTLANEVSGFAYKKIKNGDFFPSNLENRLKHFYQQSAYKNIQQLAATFGILRLLSDQGIPVIPLKGAVASDLVFNDLGVYPSDDIDILVHPNQLFHSKKIICEKGMYSETTELDEEDLLESHYHLNLSNDKNQLEIHWNLVKRYFEIPADFWWQETLKINRFGVELIELSIEKYILYTVFRLFDHCFYPLRFFVMISGLIEKHSIIIDWAKLIAYAKQYKMEKLVVFSLQLLQDILNTNIPEAIMKRKIFGFEYLKSIVVSGLFSGIKRKHIRMLIYSMLLDDPFRIFRVLIGRIFPSKSEVRLRYDIPPNSLKVYLYLLLNPFLLIFGKKPH